MQLKGLVTENLCGVKGYTTEELEKNRKQNTLRPPHLHSCDLTSPSLHFSPSPNRTVTAPSLWTFARVELDHPCRAST